MSVTGFNRRRREAAARLKAEQEQQAAQQKRARPKRKRKPKADPAGHNSADLAEAVGAPEPAEIDQRTAPRAAPED